MNYCCTGSLFILGFSEDKIQYYLTLTTDLHYPVFNIKRRFKGRLFCLRSGKQLRQQDLSHKI